MTSAGHIQRAESAELASQFSKSLDRLQIATSNVCTHQDQKEVDVNGRSRAAGILAAILAGVGFLLAGDLVTAASEPKHQRRVIHVTEKQSDDVETFVDVGQKELSIGDYNVFSNDPIYDASRSRRVGSANVDCLVVQLGPGDNAEVECDASFTLVGGMIMSEGPIDFSRRVNVWAVTGGTGAFKTIHGTLRVTQEEPGLDLRFILFL